jgi:hypothetical protein
MGGFMFKPLVQATFLASFLWGCGSLEKLNHNAVDDAAFNEALYSNLDAPRDDAAGSGGSPREALIARAEKEVRDALKDPDAAKFQAGSFASLGGQCVVGKVLAKNGFGAYDGYKGFVWTKGNVVLQESGIVPYLDASSACTDALIKESKSHP